MVDFKQLLSKPMDGIKPPPVAPAGTYYGTIMQYKPQESAWEDKDLGRKENQVVFLIKTTRADDSVDQEEVKASGFIGKLANTKGFSLEDGREWGLKMFLEGLGIATQGKTLDTALPEAIGVEVMFDISHRFDKRPGKEGVYYADVKQVRAAA